MVHSCALVECLSASAWGSLNARKKMNAAIILFVIATFSVVNGWRSTITNDDAGFIRRYARYSAQQLNGGGIMRRRRSGITYGEWRTALCVQRCTNRFKSLMVDGQPFAMAQNMTLFLENLPDQLDRFCRSYESLTSCVSSDCEAENTAFGRSVIQLFTPFDELCTPAGQTELTVAGPCMSRALHQQGSTLSCDRLCGDAIEFQQRLQRTLVDQSLAPLSSITNTGDEDETDNTNLLSQISDAEQGAMSDAVRDVCQFGSCHQHCQKRAVENACEGDERKTAIQLIEKFSKLLQDSAGKAVGLLTNGQIRLPNEGCFDSKIELPGEEEES